MGLRRTARSFRDALCVLDRLYAEVVGKFLFSVRKGSSPFLDHRERTIYEDEEKTHLCLYEYGY